MSEPRSDPLYEMILAACDLKAALPQRYDDMITALFAHEVKCIDDLLGCEEGALVEARSRARTVRELRLRLLACQQLRERNEKRR